MSAALLVLVALALTLLRVALPTLADNKSELERYLTKKTEHPIRIGELQTYWDGWHPAIRITGLDIYSPADLTHAVRLQEVRVSLALMPLLWGELRMDTLALVEPKLGLERLADGRLQVTGLGPMQQQRPAGGAGVLLWLFKQKHIVIENGEFQWFDHRSDYQRAIYVSRINVDLRNVGERHKLGIKSGLPPEICGDCSIVLDITGNPLVHEGWSGEVFINSADLNLDRLPTIVRDFLPVPVEGKIDLRLWSTWKNGQLQSARGRVALEAVSVPLQRWHTTAAIDSARADLNWRRDGDYWQLNLEDLWLGLGGPAWSAGYLRVVHGPEGITARMKQLSLDDLSRFLGGIDAESRLLTTLKRVRPQGRLQSLVIKVDGGGRRVDDYALEAKVDGLRTEPYAKVPGFAGVSGKLSTQGRGGTFLLDARDFTVTAPHVFRAPISANVVSAVLTWAIDENEWQVHGQGMHVVADDARGMGTLELRGPLKKGVKPYINLRVNFSDGNGAHASRYYPVNVMPEKLIAWLDNSIVSGHVTGGRLILDGDLGNFPFSDGAGVFEVRAHVRQGVFSYLPGWIPLTESEADLLFKNSGMLITHHQGAIGSLKVGRVVVSADDLRRQSSPVVKIDGILQGPINEARRILRAAPAPKGGGGWKDYVNMGIDTDGRGVLKLKLAIPGLDPQAFDMRGEYSVSDGELRFRIPGLNAGEVRGHVEFDRWGPTQGTLQGRLLGGDALVTVAGQRANEQAGIVLSGHGTFTAAGLFEALRWNPLRYLQGDAPWTGTMRLQHGSDRVRLEADLQGIKSLLPAPLDRPAGISQTLVLESTPARQGDRLVTVRIGEHIDSRFLFAREADNWIFNRGALALGSGEAQLPGGPGLDISARARHVDADPWFKIFKQHREALSSQLLRRLRGDFESLYLFGRMFGKFEIDLLRNPGVWAGRLSGSAVAGHIRLVEGQTRPLDTIHLDLEHLNIPAKKPQPDQTATDPRMLPSVRLNAKSFRYEDMPLGKLDLVATHMTAGWRIAQLQVVRPEMTLSLNGAWSYVNDQSTTELQLKF
ncbi:MAG: AsmA family protein, partial [Burkholderiales bacterium]|nr:AsmA family protein [Burkholderiales bacterium]